MVDKLNELRLAFVSKQLEIKSVRTEFETKLSNLESECEALEKELSLAEDVAKATGGFVKIQFDKLFV